MKTIWKVICNFYFGENSKIKSGKSQMQVMKEIANETNIDEGQKNGIFWLLAKTEV